MKKCNPSHGQNGQLVHWWVLVHSGRKSQETNMQHGEGPGGWGTRYRGLSEPAPVTAPPVQRNPLWVSLVGWSSVFLKTLPTSSLFLFPVLTNLLHFFLLDVSFSFSCMLDLLIWSKIRIWRNIIPCYKGMITLVLSKITMQHGGEFGITRLATKTQQNLGASEMNLFVFNSILFLFFLIF